MLELVLALPLEDEAEGSCATCRVDDGVRLSLARETCTEAGALLPKLFCDRLNGLCMCAPALRASAPLGVAAMMRVCLLLAVLARDEMRSRLASSRCIVCVA